MGISETLLVFFLVFTAPAAQQVDTEGNDCTTPATTRWKRDGATLCPAQHQIDPCICNANFNTVTCSGLADEVRLAEIFAGFPNVRITKVDISNSDIVVLTSGVFGKIKIHDLEISNSAVKSVEANVFSGSENTVLYINLNRNKIEHFSFGSIRPMVSLRQLQLAYNRLTEIPDNAFGDKLSKLDFLALNNNRIEKLGKSAFRHLHALSFLDLSHNDLIELGSETMAFSPRLDKPLSVILNKNNISFVDKKAFEGKIPTFLSLIQNNLKTLDEEIFEPIVKSMMESTTVVGLALQGNPIECDCQVKWILNIPTDQLNITLRQLECSDGRIAANLTTESLGCV